MYQLILLKNIEISFSFFLEFLQSRYFEFIEFSILLIPTLRCIPFRFLQCDIFSRKHKVRLGKGLIGLGIRVNQSIVLCKTRYLLCFQLVTR